MEIKIVSIRARADGSGVVLTVTLTGDGGSETRRLPLTDDQYLTLHPKKGEITPEAFEALEAASALCATLTTGARMLGAAPHSGRDLERRLRRKGADAENARAAVDYLTERGYIREDEDASREAERCLRKNWSERHIVAQLFQKGYSEEVVRRVREDVLADVDFVVVCARLIESRWHPESMGEDDVRKMLASLMRAGFPPSQIRDALKSLRAGNLSVETDDDPGDF